MATTYPTTDNRTMVWGTGIAVVLALLIIFTMRTISREDTLTNVTVEAPAANDSVEKRTDVPPTTVPTDSVQPRQ